MSPAWADDYYEPLYDEYPEWDPYYMDPENFEYDPYDDAIIIDVDGVDFLPRDDQELWDEYQQDVVDLAGEIAGQIAGWSVANPLGDAADPKAMAEQAGKVLLGELWLVAKKEGWNPFAYERDARAVVDAVNEVQEALDDAAAVTQEAANQVQGLVGDAVGSGLAAAALAIPALAAAVPAIVNAKQERQDRRLKRKKRRGSRREERQAEIQARRDALAERSAELDEQGPQAGIYDFEDGEWGPAAEAGGVKVRAKWGKRAAIAELGHGYHLVREFGEGVATEVVRAQMQAAILSANQAIQSTPAAIAGPIDVGACACATRRC